MSPVERWIYVLNMPWKQSLQNSGLFFYVKNYPIFEILATLQFKIKYLKNLIPEKGSQTSNGNRSSLSKVSNKILQHLCCREKQKHKEELSKLDCMHLTQSWLTLLNKSLPCNTALVATFNVCTK